MRTLEVEFTGNGLAEIAFSVKATNPLTGLTGEYSCQVVVDVSREGDVDFCGELGGAVGTGAPGTFLGIDLDESGIGAEAAGWFLGILMIVTLTAALAIGGPVMMGFGGLLGLGLSVGFGLIPIWFVVVLFMVGAGAVVLLRR